MTLSKDIRDRLTLSGDEILALNFINTDSPYLFRKYYRSGLRSHIFEVLKKQDLKKEQNGILQDGLKIFPRACPIKIFRIFRNRFKTVDQVFHEIQKYNMLVGYYGYDLIARSEEFIVEYNQGTGTQILLCGLQEYVDGEILDPWKILDGDYIQSFFNSMYTKQPDLEKSIQRAKNKIQQFVGITKKIFMDTGYIPDLAGIGNLLLTCNGNFKLVDINNISKLEWNDSIPLDDKNYPSCDISVEVLLRLEENILGNSSCAEDPIYAFFMKKDRQSQVKELEKIFYTRLKST